jgi:hypothetical protein
LHWAYRRRALGRPDPERHHRERPEHGGPGSPERRTQQLEVPEGDYPAGDHGPVLDIEPCRVESILRSDSA